MIIPVDLTIGSAPSEDLQVNNPRLRNMYVSKDKNLFSMPALQAISLIKDVRAIHWTTYQGGSYIVATTSQILRVSPSGATSPIAPIVNTGLAVRMDENEQAQVIIVDGAAAYVLAQAATPPTFTKLGVDQGFDLLNPVDVRVLNTFAVIVGGTDKKWVPSSANNALVYTTNDVVVTDESMGNLIAVATLHNNLYIFGQFRVQRWAPSYQRISYDFPFQLDTNFSTEYGCVSTASVIANADILFFLSSNYTLQTLSSNSFGAREEIGTPGMGKIFSQYTKPSLSFGSIYFYSGNWFYQITFNEDAWVYCLSSGKFCEYDMPIIGCENNTVITEEGLYSLTSTQTERMIEWISSTIELQTTHTDIYRAGINAFKLSMVEGFNQSPPLPQDITQNNSHQSNDSIDPVEVGVCLNPLSYIGQNIALRAVSLANQYEAEDLHPGCQTFQYMLPGSYFLSGGSYRGADGKLYSPIFNNPYVITEQTTININYEAADADTPDPCIELALSKDNLNWSSSIPVPIGKTGETLHQMLWRMNVTGAQFTFRLRYYGKLSLSFKKASINQK